MGWQALLRDVEGQFDAALAADLAAEVADRTRREAARLRLVDRLRPAVGSALAVAVTGAGTVRGRLAALGPDWLLLAEPPGRDILVPLAAVTWLDGLSARSGEPAAQGAVESRLRLGHALRSLARDRAVVTAVLRDGTTLTGTVDRVGQDFVELTIDRRAEGAAAGRPAVRTVPHAALALLRAT